MSEQSTSIQDVLSELNDLADSEGEVSISDVMEKLGKRGSGVFLLVPGLLGISPLAAIPTVPTIFGVIIALLAGQILFGKSPLWLPKFLRKRSVEDDKLKKAVDRLEGPAEFLDRWFGNRLETLTGETAVRIAAIACLVLCVTIPPLEVVPFAAALPLGAIAAFGLALTLRDGAVMLAAFIFSAVALVTGVMMIM